MPEAKASSSDSRRMLKNRSKSEVVAEARRLGHDISVRAQAVESSPHPILALEQLEAELEYACHLVRDVRRLIACQ